MSETLPVARVEPILDQPPPANGPHEVIRLSEPAPPLEPAGAAPPVIGRAEPIRVSPEPAEVQDPVPTASGAPVATEQLARIEDKTARIEEKFARSEAATQRVVDRFDAASSRMSEVALQADLHAVRADVSAILKGVRGLPSFTSLVWTALITAILTAALTILIIRYLPGLLLR